MEKKVYCENCKYYNYVMFYGLSWHECNHPTNIERNCVGEAIHGSPCHELNKNFDCKNFKFKWYIKLLNFFKREK